MPRNTAFIYDFLLVRGGAERLALHVKDAFPAMDMVFGFIDREQFPAGDYPEDVYRALTSPSNIKGWQGLKVMSACKRHAGFLKAYDRVIFSGVYAPVAVQHRPQGGNIYYCHTPPRFVYDLKSHYLQTATGWQRPLIKALTPIVKRNYESSLKQMDVVITNSKNVQERLRQYVGIEDAVVIHPPVEVNRYEWLGQENYFLSTARLEPYKRVDMIVQAFMQMPDRKLVVASGGSELSRLRKVAEDHANIRFTGWCSDRELRELLGRCTASIYLPMDEDFGISPIESMAAGKPVITVNEGGTRETVVHGETGLLLSPSVLDNPGSACAAISTAVEQISSQWADMRTACEHRATLYDVSVFDGKIRNLVHET